MQVLRSLKRDASEKAIGAVLYLPVTAGMNLIGVKLLTAKKKLAPNREISFFRLELGASLLFVRLTADVTAVLGSCSFNAS